MALNCRDAAKLLSEKRDRRLSWPTRLKLRFHMLLCKMCRVYGTQLDAVGCICKEAGIRAEDMCPGEMSVEQKQRIRSALGKND